MEHIRPGVRIVPAVHVRIGGCSSATTATETRRRGKLSSNASYRWRANLRGATSGEASRSTISCRLRPSAS